MNNTYRDSQEYRTNIRNIADGYSVPVFQRYYIIVDMQENIISKVDRLNSGLHIGSTLVSDFLNMFYHDPAPVISVIDYHRRDSNVDSSEHVCAFSRITANVHNIVDSAAQANMTLTKDISGALLNSTVFSQHFYGSIERNGDTEEAPAATVTSLIDSISATYSKTSLDSVIFPPEFFICGFFIEDMITPIVLALRNAYPNSYINIDNCVSIQHFINGSYVPKLDIDAREKLNESIVSQAVVRIADVLDDISNQ